MSKSAGKILVLLIIGLGGSIIRAELPPCPKNIGELIKDYEQLFAINLETAEAQAPMASKLNVERGESVEVGERRVNDVCILRNTAGNRESASYWGRK